MFCFGCRQNIERFTFGVYQAKPRVDRVIVKKKDHKLLLMSGDAVVKSYSVALARGGLAPKQRQGDHKTQKGRISSTREIRPASSIGHCMSLTQTKQIRSEHAEWVLIRVALS
jgi:murein L,D-transpeptidase YafK